MHTHDKGSQNITGSIDLPIYKDRDYYNPISKWVSGSFNTEVNESGYQYHPSFENTWTYYRTITTFNANNSGAWTENIKFTINY